MSVALNWEFRRSEIEGWTQVKSMLILDVIPEMLIKEYLKK